MVNIKVAVRIRPLSQREILQKDEIIARKDNKSILVTNPKIPERQDGDSRQRTRRFAVDFCYDPSDPDDCSQQAVYREIGAEVLDSMFEGYNACVLAYGHSASGKTYTIMGLQDDPGLTPRLCQGLFEKIEEKSAAGKIRFHITVSFLEIYNEKVRDLLAGDDTENFSLRVREHPKLGPYVQGLSQHLVTDRRKLLGLLSFGNKRRSTAATENNVHSSRSHAVFTIQFRQSDGENFETEKSSKVHLVDLAGSLHEAQEVQFDERASPAQSKARLKEGANINKSLVTLGNVISALAESCENGIPSKEHSSKTWQPFVPYRDSVLTWLLKDTLGGNSNTIMIATISPASGCLSETINTLRYAKRTKRIVNQPIVNEDPKIRTIRQLKEEIARLKNLLFSYHSWRNEDEAWETWSELDRTNLEESMSKWPEPGGTQITVCQESFHKREDLDRLVTEEDICEEEKGESENLVERPTNVSEQVVRTLTTEGCKISDEKSAAVNGSVNDNFSHEVFSDSLESFSSAFLKSDDELGQTNGTADAVTETEPKRDNHKMSHRNRPDLIKGISSRSKDAPSSSCTDVSNLSQSTSENSLNSSGSVDAQPDGGRRRSIEIKKKDKRSEIVEAVTSRLYVTKKKVEAPKKEEDEDDGELEELKLCKRARMKLFDLSRKLAMTRKIKKTMDNDTQTDFQATTVRVKEKCVLTDPTEVAVETNTADEVKEKPCVIMNQVFIPKWSNYVVECGKVVRIEGGCESGTQTEHRRYANANTSPVKFSPRSEDFSDDSLEVDSQAKSEVVRDLEFSVDETFSSGELPKETFSSENSFTSVDGTDAASSSGSSEDFVFYESPKDAKTKADRELYTITENSEQSDPSDVFSPVQSQSFFNSEKERSGGESSRSTEPLTVNVPRVMEVPKTKQVNWADLKDKQYLNINILDSKRTPFSVDTHLFGKTYRDQSTDTMFTSADSITFVFMGPAKSKTSVLMELIKRSLGKNEQANRKRSKGVQCDANLIRSVSIDTAMIALSRIAKNQPANEFPRAVSLETLTPDEVVTILGQNKLHGFKENGCQTELESQRKSALKCSVSTSTAADENAKTDEPEKPKKSVSWSGETKYDFNLNYYETEAPESNENACEAEVPKRDQQTENSKMSAFLEEATELLRNINYYSSKCQDYGNPSPVIRPSVSRSSTEDRLELSKGRVPSSGGEDYSTWPRRRPPVGKPPTCPRPRSRQSLFFRSYSNGSSESSASWNVSNLSTSFSSCLGDRSPSSRSSYSNPRESPRPNIPKLDFSELEAELEESCRRLELAVEQDKIREEICNQSYSVDVIRPKTPEILKRRKTEDCLTGCCCQEQRWCRWSKCYRSTLELDSFGPGSKHCQQLCMFCRKKEAEVYSSAVDLNSECHSGRCRLNYYGYCPCSPVRLNHVSFSPRAYMQHLLTLRRQIVGQTSRNSST